MKCGNEQYNLHLDSAYERNVFGFGLILMDLNEFEFHLNIMIPSSNHTPRTISIFC